MAEQLLFEDDFSITGVDSQKYDRCARLFGTSLDGRTQLHLDVNTQLYPCHKGETLHLLLSNTLNVEAAKAGVRKDGDMDVGGGGGGGGEINVKEEAKTAWRDVARGEPTLADHYEYVAHGKIYRFEEGGGDSLKVYISFGGLLLYLEGPYKKLTGLRIDYIYLLVRKTKIVNAKEDDEVKKAMASKISITSKMG